MNPNEMPAQMKEPLAELEKEPRQAALETQIR